jgi:hypothetical protein
MACANLVVVTTANNESRDYFCSIASPDVGSVTESGGLGGLFTRMVSRFIAGTAFTAIVYP